MTTNCTSNRLSVLSSVLSVVGCYALRPKSLSMPYSFGHFLTVRLLLQGWSEKYDRTKDITLAIRLYQSTEKKPCGGDFPLHPQGLTLRAIKATAIPLPDRLRLQGLCMSMVYKEYALDLSVRLSDYWQVIALNEQHNRAC